MNILIVGSGYVGLVFGACFAEMGHKVICLDIDKAKIQALQEGHLPFYEPGLAELTERNIQAGRLSFTSDYAQACTQATLCFIAVPTPSLPSGECDLSYVEAAVTAIAKTMKSSKILVMKSTVPVGTSDKIQAWVKLHQEEEIPFAVVSNPEFLKEGSAISDCMKPDRIVIGTNSPEAENLLKELYASFNVSSDRILCMDPRSAELCKYAANAMLASRISFMNEIAGLCEHTGANIHLIRKALGQDKRIGKEFLYAGTGYGGSCFPKDIRALVALSRSLNCYTPLIESIEQTNCHQKLVIGRKMERFFADLGGLRGKKIAIWGLSFKPDTDDVREAPALELIHFLLEQKAEIVVFDPIAMPHAKLQLKTKVRYATSEYDAVKGVDAIALMTEWKQFRFVDFTEIAALVRAKVFFDGRNQYAEKKMASLGFLYFGIGVQTIENVLVHT